MANKNATLVLRGTTMYAKVLGDPILNYNKDGKEWKLDLVPMDPKAVKQELKAYGIADRLRTKDGYADNKPFMSFKQKEFKTNGEENKPIEVVDILGKPWPQDKLIGNGSVIDIKFAVVDYGPGKKHGVYPRKIRVLELVPYEGGGFEPISEDDEYFAKAAAAAMKEEGPIAPDFEKDFGLETDDDDLNDDLP